MSDARHIRKRGAQVLFRNPPSNGHLEPASTGDEI